MLNFTTFLPIRLLDYYCNGQRLICTLKKENIIKCVKIYLGNVVKVSPWKWLKLWCSRSRWTRWDLLACVAVGCWGCRLFLRAGKRLPRFPLQCLWWLEQMTKPRTPNPGRSPQTRCTGLGWKRGSLPGPPYLRPSLKAKEDRLVCNVNISVTLPQVESGQGQHLHALLSPRMFTTITFQ